MIHGNHILIVVGCSKNNMRLNLKTVLRNTFDNLILSEYCYVEEHPNGKKSCFQWSNMTYYMAYLIDYGDTCSWLLLFLKCSAGNVDT